MKNPLIDGYEAEEIRQLVAQLIRDIGSPEPPVSLDDVREQLKLDRRYYSTTDHSFVSEMVHSVKIGKRELLRRAKKMITVIREAGIRALFLKDKKRILIDADLHQAKHRWAEGHEIIHSIIPWHDEFLLGDTESELVPTCHAQIEAEANFGDGQLLFLQDRFVEEAMSLPLNLDSVKALKGTFNNTFTSTLWRFVEEYRGPKPVVGIVSVHPIRLSDDFNPQQPCRYVIQSQQFRSQFADVSETDLFALLQGYCGGQRGGPLGASEVILKDDNGDDHVFGFETFSNTYDALTLGVHRRKVGASVNVPVAP